MFLSNPHQRPHQHLQSKLCRVEFVQRSSLVSFMYLFLQTSDLTIRRSISTPKRVETSRIFLRPALHQRINLFSLIFSGAQTKVGGFCIALVTSNAFSVLFTLEKLLSMYHARSLQFHRHHQHLNLHLHRLTTMDRLILNYFFPDHRHRLHRVSTRKYR